MAGNGKAKAKNKTIAFEQARADAIATAIRAASTSAPEWGEFTSANFRDDWNADPKHEEEQIDTGSAGRKLERLEKRGKVTCRRGAKLRFWRLVEKVQDE